MNLTVIIQRALGFDGERRDQQRDFVARRVEVMQVGAAEHHRFGFQVLR